jgi:hypothetical protein
MEMDNYNLFEDFEYKGFWWLPEQPENKVPGSLSYKCGDIMTLELLGSLQNTTLRGSHEGSSNPDTILGIAEGKRLCTLNGILHTKSRFNKSSGIFRSTYIIERLLEGKHFSSSADIKFSSISINYTSLEEWITHIPFNEDIQEDETSRIIKTTASHEYPHSVFEADVPSLNCKIKASLEISSSVDTRVLEWESTGYIQIVPTTASDYEWFRRVLGDLRNLLTLFMNAPTYPKLIKAAGDEVEISPGIISKETIYIYYVQSIKSIERDIHPAEMLLIFPAVEQSICQILELWFSKAELLRPVYTLFFGSMYFGEMYDRFHFLNLIQAVESFHRDMRTGRYTTREQFNKIRKSLIDAIPSDVAGDFRQSLESRIAFGNEYSLRTRIRLLFQELEEKTAKLLTRDVEVFISKLVATRNYFTHYTRSLKRKALTGDDLHYVNRKLQVLLIILLLKEVGLSEPAIRRSICQNDSLTYSLAEGQNVRDFLSQYCADYLPKLTTTR